MGEMLEQDATFARSQPGSLEMALELVATKCLCATGYEALCSPDHLGKAQLIISMELFRRFLWSELGSSLMATSVLSSPKLAGGPQKGPGYKPQHSVSAQALSR